MTSSLKKSQMKWDLFRQYCRKKVTSLSKALCQLYLQFKWPLAQDKIVLWEKKNCFQLFELIFPVHLIHSYIHSSDSSGQLREGLYCHWQQLVKTFPVPAFFGATPAVTLKRTEKNFFELRKEAKDPRPVNELRTILQRNQWKTIKKGSFGPKGHLGIKNRISSNLLWSSCFIFSYFSLCCICDYLKKKLFLATVF